MVGDETESGPPGRETLLALKPRFGMSGFPFRALFARQECSSAKLNSYQAWIGSQEAKQGGIQSMFTFQISSQWSPRPLAGSFGKETWGALTVREAKLRPVVKVGAASARRTPASAGEKKLMKCGP